MQASQYQNAFTSKKLCNWEVPATERARTPAAKHPAANGPTKFIVSDDGHLLRSSPSKSSFITGYENSTAQRWPEHLPTSPYAGSSTMGYKGIETTYLPTSTIYLKNNPDSNEAIYH